jgi:hypothetical protein
MAKHVLLTGLVSAPLLLPAAHAADEVRWQGRLLMQVTTKSQLPPAVRSALHMDDPGMAGVADPGHPFNTGDAHVREWPDRALLGAGHVGEHWIVLLVADGGQSAPTLWWYEFEGSKLLDSRRLRYWKGPDDTFAAVVAQVAK